MQLTKQLAEKKASSKQKIPAEKLKVMLDATERLKEQSLSDHAIQNGAQLPAFELPDATGKSTSLHNFTEDNLIISFYRGGWCPYCNLELRALESVLPQLRNFNTAIIAISPETPDHSLTTTEKNELSFTVLSDLNNSYAKSLGLVFQLPEDLQAVYEGFNLRVDQHNGNHDFELPMPATFIVNRDRQIIHRFVPEDYTKRLDPEAILGVLREQAVSG